MFGASETISVNYTPTMLHDAYNRLRYTELDFYPELIKYLFHCSESNCTNKKWELCSIFKETKRSIQRDRKHLLLNDLQIGNFFVKIVETFANYGTKHRELEAWMIANTCADLEKKRSKGVFSSVNAFFQFIRNDDRAKDHLIDRPVKKPNYGDQERLTIGKQEIVDCYNFMGKIWEEKMIRTDISLLPDIEKFIYLHLNPNSMNHLMRTCRKYNKDTFKNEYLRTNNIKMNLRSAEILAEFLPNSAQQLEKLDITREYLTDESAIEFLKTHFKSIKILKIKASLVKIGTKILKELNSIHSLSIYLGDRSFNRSNYLEASNLKKLKLKIEGVKPFDISFIKKFTNLQSLSFNLFKMMNIASISELPALKYLKISGQCEEELPLSFQRFEFLDVANCIYNLNQQVKAWPTFKGSMGMSDNTIGEGEFSFGKLHGKGIVKILSTGAYYKDKLKRFSVVIEGIFRESVLTQGKVTYKFLEQKDENKVFAILEGVFSQKEGMIHCEGAFSYSDKMIKNISEFRSWGEVISNETNHKFIQPF